MSDMPTLLRDIGVTYRQFDWWCTKGYIPDLGDDQNPGNGVSRHLRPSQIRHLRTMARLVNAGVRPEEASAIAGRLCAGKLASIGGFLVAPNVFYQGSLSMASRARAQRREAS